MELLACLPLGVCMHLRPRHAFLLMQTCRQAKDAVESNQEYWTRVAAHLVWRGDVAEIAATRFAALFYIDEGYACAMDKVVRLIQRAVQQRGTVGHGFYFDVSEDTEEEILVADDTTTNRKCIEYWSPYVHETLEVQTRMKLLETPSTNLNVYRLSDEECRTLPMKDIAKSEVMRNLENQFLDEEHTGAAMMLRKWARDFAELEPHEIAGQSQKAKLIHDLVMCIVYRWDGAKLLKLRRSAIVQILGALCEATEPAAAC